MAGLSFSIDKKIDDEVIEVINCIECGRNMVKTTLGFALQIDFDKFIV